MVLLIFVPFGLLLNLPQSLETQDVALREIIIEHHVTGILGEEVFLPCSYSGKYDIIDSSWKHMDSGKRTKVMAGYKNGKPFAKGNFGTPSSLTNLTVTVTINSLEVEGEYTCVFTTDEEEIMETLLLSVIARPHVNVYAEEDVMNETHYQSIFCSASYSKPKVSLHWDMNGAPPSKDIFSIHSTDSIFPNGTNSIVSMLRFPIELNNESNVACVIHHPTLTLPNRTVMKLQTFVSPNVTFEVNLTEKEGKEFFEVLCRAKGGRPPPSTTWTQPESADTSCSDYLMKPELVSSCSHCFPLDVCDGENIICNFGYPHHSVIKRTVTLPSYHLSSVQLTNSSITVNQLNSSAILILEEEEEDIVISMNVTGNVPRYKINCTKHGEPLPDDMKVVVSDLVIKGPARANHVGQYQCQASYYRHIAILQFEIELKPRVQVTAPIHVTLLNNTSWENGTEYRELKCIADNVPPDTNITWDTEECSSGISNSEVRNIVTGRQQVHSVVWNTARLPVYSYAGCTVICVVHHQWLEKPVEKSIRFPLIEPPRSYVTIRLRKNSTHWAAVCEYKSYGAKADISWVVSDITKTSLNLTSNTKSKGSEMMGICIYEFELCQHEGEFLTCVIQNEYKEVERRTIQVPSFFISSIVILNKTIPLLGNHGHHTGLHRVALKEHVSNQRILFRVNGNASACAMTCFRSNGQSAHTDGMALIFAQQVSQSDAGLYSCSASWNHPNATITVLVDVTSQDNLIVLLILICSSSAVAITLILMVTICIFCKRKEGNHSSPREWKKRESLASLMHDPRSPELKKASGQRQEYKDLMHCSIVIDVKSTV